MAKAGARQGWCAVLCLHMTWLFSTGLIKGLGVMLPSLVEQFSAPTWVIGWMVTIVSGVVCFTGPGLGISLILTRTLVGMHFTDNYATASGIGSSGHAVGLVLIAPFTQLLLDTYGWRGAMLLLGGLSMHLAPCGALLRTPPRETDSYETLPASEHDQLVSQAHSADKKTACCKRKDDILARFGCSVCLRVAYWRAAIVLICFRFVPALWVVYFVSHAQAKGFSAYDAVMFTTAAGAGSFVCKIASGLVVDRGLMSLRWAMSLCIVVASSTLICISWTNSYWSMMVNAFCHYGANGAVGSFCDIYTKELLGVEHLGSAMSWMELMAAVLLMAFGFFPGWIYDQTRSFDLAFVIMGGIQALPLVSLFMEWVMMRRQQRA
ncbi:monocarboxylate transporter 12-like [Patiria miniata]|uniref:Monocarboxylate transporter n=1 Tax=Patiria miniata TaxID=46514 RepID=A0A914ARY5_PATMI|nr:monocarboxylate transporter 12-like [Patiria miniata]